MNLLESNREAGLRNGYTMLEVVCAAGILLVIITFSMKMTLRIDGIWSDVGQHRVALHELSNQLEELTLLPSKEVASRLQSLTISMESATVLPKAKLTGELIEDDFGSRVVLRLNWLRRHPGVPVNMTAWLLETAAGPRSLTQTTTEAPR
jgi:hypothetical protein